jgi:DNA-binding MarR family transcriptional regulator
LGPSEYAVLDELSRQDLLHMRMQELSAAAGLSQSATTRLVARLERRGLLQRLICEEDRRGIYTEITAEGQRVLAAARATHDRALTDALGAAATVPELAALVRAVERGDR